MKLRVIKAAVFVVFIAWAALPYVAELVGAHR
jgi:hypothetical protein